MSVAIMLPVCLIFELVYRNSNSNNTNNNYCLCCMLFTSILYTILYLTVKNSRI